MGPDLGLVLCLWYLEQCEQPPRTTQDMNCPRCGLINPGTAQLATAAMTSSAKASKSPTSFQRLIPHQQRLPSVLRWWLWFWQAQRWTRARLGGARLWNRRERRLELVNHENHFPFTALVFFYCCCNSLRRFSDFLVACGNRSGTQLLWARPRGCLGRQRGAAGGPGTYNAIV